MKLLRTWTGNVMNLEYLKTLWMLRFEKMKKTEEDAAGSYQEGSMFKSCPKTNLLNF